MKKIIGKMIVVILIILLIVSINYYNTVKTELALITKENTKINKELNGKINSLNNLLTTEKEYNTKLIKENKEINKKLKLTEKTNTILLEQKSESEKAIASYRGILQYEPYFETKEKKYKDIITTFAGEYYDAILSDEKTKLYWREDMISHKRSVELGIIMSSIYRPLESEMFFTFKDNDNLILVPNEENRIEYKKYMKAIEDFYLTIDIKNLTEKEIIEKITKKIANKFSYDINNENPNNGNALSIIKKDKIVCSGYTDILKSVLDMAHIKNEKVLGKMKNIEKEFHIWNEVTLSNGEKYYIDITWADFEEENKYDKKYVLNKYKNFQDENREVIANVTIDNYEIIEQAVHDLNKK